VTLQSGIEPRVRASGSGAARRGVHAWAAERISAIALVPLMLWMVASIVVLHGASYAAFVGWLRRPVSSVLMVLSLITVFHHTALGLQVIVEDYIHSALKVPAIVTTRLVCFTLCVVGLLATLRIVLMR
jgi:succinate dehydrogenase / fumarate reductase membrane anchor subunit